MSDIDLTEIRLQLKRYTGAIGASQSYRAHQLAAVVPALLDRVELLQAEVDRERGKVGDLVRKLNDITRGQGEVWPAGASLPAGPPLPRRVPGESLKPCGWMGIEPMTDPALEDRTEGSSRERPTGSI